MTVHQRLIGIDWGEKRIGVAISGGEGNRQALPLSVVTNTAQGLEVLEKIIGEEKIIKIIVGLPLTAGGKPTEKTKLAKEFGRMLQEKIEIPVEHVDERLSTKAAQRVVGIKNNMNVDDLAAQHILQSYIDQHA